MFRKNSDKSLHRRIIFAAMITIGILLTGCYSITYPPQNVAHADTGFWFSLDPQELTMGERGWITAPVTGNREIDPLLLKCELLIISLRKGTAFEFYSEERIQYELKMTLAMIDSRDPVKIFSGPSIILAQPAFDILLKKRNALELYLEKSVSLPAE